jgi:hypothetical protein
MEKLNNICYGVVMMVKGVRVGLYGIYSRRKWAEKKLQSLIDNKSIDEDSFVATFKFNMR